MNIHQIIKLHDTLQKLFGFGVAQLYMELFTVEGLGFHHIFGVRIRKGKRFSHVLALEMGS